MLHRFICLVGLFGSLTANAQGVTRSQTEAQAQALVQTAVQYAKDHGTFKLLQAINRQDPALRHGELYLWMVDLEEQLMAAHGANAKLVGQDFSGARDADNVPYAQKAVEIAVAKGNGWFDYKFKNPETGKIQSKSCYCEKYKFFVIACGAYKE